jgi:uncharacterized membrane protein
VHAGGGSVTLFQGFLFAHILGAIIAFGPTFSFPIIGRLGAMEREHANFATRVSLRLAEVQLLPLAILQGITGAALIIVGNIDVLAKGWLLVAIVLYLVAIGYGLFVQTPTVRKVVAMTSGGPPAGGPPAGAPAGPPPELLRLIRRVQLGGLFLMALIVTIVFLMVVKPGA